MHASTKTIPNITDPDSPTTRRFVDPNDLICPGCGEQVVGAPPVSGSGPDPEPGAGFSHLDRSELCRTRAGQLAEPVEAAR
jgi:hypothetical protein